MEIERVHNSGPADSEAEARASLFLVYSYVSGALFAMTTIYVLFMLYDFSKRTISMIRTRRGRERARKLI